MVCDLIEKFECAGKFTMCGNNVTRKYWLIADRPNEAYTPVESPMIVGLYLMKNDAVMAPKVGRKNVCSAY